MHWPMVRPFICILCEQRVQCALSLLHDSTMQTLLPNSYTINGLWRIFSFDAIVVCLKIYSFHPANNTIQYNWSMISLIFLSRLKLRIARVHMLLWHRGSGTAEQLCKKDLLKVPTQGSIPYSQVYRPAALTNRPPCHTYNYCLSVVPLVVFNLTTRWRTVLLVSWRRIVIRWVIASCDVSRPPLVFSSLKSSIYCLNCKYG